MKLLAWYILNYQYWPLCVGSRITRIYCISCYEIIMEIWLSWWSVWAGRQDEDDNDDNDDDLYSVVTLYSVFVIWAHMEYYYQMYQAIFTCFNIWISVYHFPWMHALSSNNNIEYRLRYINSYFVLASYFEVE